MWIKKGHIFSNNVYNTGYAQDAFIDPIENDVWRIYYSTRTNDITSLPFFIDVEANNPLNILNIKEEPLFYPGTLGSFDENGITMTSIVNVGEEKFLYYCGWNRRKTTPYSLSIGMVIVKKNGELFDKKFKGPILDRNKYDPIAVSAPMVIFDESIFKMWYITFTDWILVNNNLEPIFIIKYATSKNGIDWETSPDVCLESDYYGESLARPWVIKDNGIYKMWFSSRGARGYRNKDGEHYEIQYAESLDGKNWKRIKSKNNIITLSEAGWDSEMLAYASVLKNNNKYFMLYNGNDFGKTGFGLAIKEI
jgi:hypothetical protein